jgi:hypothetical protein
MKGLLVAVAAVLVVFAMPAGAQLSPQQQRMKDCNTHASGMTGDARKQFMSSCLSGGAAETKGPHCTKGKPCGNSCIAVNEVCRIIMVDCFEMILERLAADCDPLLDDKRRLGGAERVPSMAFEV